MEKYYSHTYINSDGEKTEIKFEIFENNKTLKFRKGVNVSQVAQKFNLNNYFKLVKKISEREFIVSQVNDIPYQNNFEFTIKNYRYRLFKRNNIFYNNIDNSILIYLNGSDVSLVERIINKHFGIIENKLDDLVFVTFLKSIDEDKAYKELRKLDQIIVEINFSKDTNVSHNILNESNFTYNDPPLRNINNKLYNSIKQIHSPKQKGNSKIRIGIIDDGVYPHKCIKNALELNSGYDYVSKTINQSFDKNDFHGTMCAGIIGGQVSGSGKNEYGIFGVASGCTLIPFKIKKDKETSIIYFLKAVYDICITKGDKKISVINCSLEIPFQKSEIMKKFISKMISIGREGLGMPFVMAAGNKGRLLSFLTKIPEVIVVSSVHTNKSPRSDSNYGKEVLISAYGEKVVTLDKPGPPFADNTEGLKKYNDFIYFKGTSAAAPQVTGAIALLLSKDPDMDLNTIKKNIKDSKDEHLKTNFKNWYGVGILNLNKLNL